MNLLLLSSSRVDGTEYLEHAESLIKTHLGERVKNLLFIPYAGVSLGFESYLNMVSKAFNALGYSVESIHNHNDQQKALLESDAILVGGGNTFCLLNSLYEHKLVETLKEKVKSGTPYIGWSAGSNMAAPSIKTTNDMPIIEPPSFSALGLIRCQINPHYLDGNPPGHQGETREQRIAEFLAVNPDVEIIGIPEGTALVTRNGGLFYHGHKEGYLFNSKDGKQTISPGSDLSRFLNF